MSANPRISLEQWRSLVAVVDAGGYAQAAERLHKSQSAVTHAVQKLQSLLGVQAFRIEGRRAVLTDTGQLLYRRGRALLEEAEHAENAARTLSAGWEAEIRVAAELIRDAMAASVPVLRPFGRRSAEAWHLPFITDEDRAAFDLDTLRRISVARCARVSYLTHDGKRVVNDTAVGAMDAEDVEREAIKVKK